MTELQLEVGRWLGREGGEGELNSATDQVLVVIDDDHDGVHNGDDDGMMTMIIIIICVTIVSQQCQCN